MASDFIPSRCNLVGVVVKESHARWAGQPDQRANEDYAQLSAWFIPRRRVPKTPSPAFPAAKRTLSQGNPYRTHPLPHPISLRRTPMRFSLILSLVVLMAISAGTMAAPPEEAVIRTPQPSLQPRINGAMVFGVRPGHPFLYTIAATGRRPMEFAADGLPEGLKLDTASGQISGAVSKPGEYFVILRARNALGDAERKFRIVVGDRLALTPHMGWNSWYCWTDRVTDKIMRNATDIMITSGMINHGYSYVNIDAGWAVRPGSKDPNFGGQPRDAQGNINPNRRFPDMKALTDYIHHRGLKAGIYCGPGPSSAAAASAAISTRPRTPATSPTGDSTSSNTTGAPTRASPAKKPWQT